MEARFTPRCAASVALVLSACVLSACGPNIPARYVLERDVGEFQYRRYQEVLDVEFPIEGNTANGHTATYLRRGTRQDGADLRVATAFVTVYSEATSLSAEIRERLETLNSYELAVRKINGEWVWVLDGGDIPWVIWVSGRHLIKLGGSPEEVDDEDSDTEYGIPDDILEAYTDLFSSDLDGQGQAREGSPSYGASHSEAEDSEELEIPASLRDDAPI
ncbi:MAG: hypothetical protein ACI9KE_000613 [Polyangiales bacterium]|jgi:hypothetical protein